MSKKKIDPEVQRQEFEAWKLSEEYAFWLEIHEMQKEKLKRISETSKDLDFNGKFQVLWDMYYKLSDFLKVKPVMKELRHEWVRSIYFGEKTKDEPAKGKDGVVVPLEPDKYDGIPINLVKDVTDAQHNLRQVLIKSIYNNFDDLDPMRLNETTYQKIRADLKKAIVELFKKFKVFLKKQYKIVYEQLLMKALGPLKNFLEINARLYLFEAKYRTAEERSVFSFKHKAYIEKFCVATQVLLQILNDYHSKSLKYNPDIHRVFNKLNYEGWKNNKIENWYLSKLEEALQNLKRNSMVLFSTGINFWICPLETNTNTVADLTRLVNWEMICERLLGNELVRDQFNFIFSVVSLIHNANSLSAKYLKLGDYNSLEIALPKLAAYKSAQRMRDILDAMEKESEKEEKETKKEEEKVDLGVTTNSFKKSTVSSKDINKELEMQQLMLLKQQEEASRKKREKFGRLYIWEGFLDAEHKKCLQECAEKLKNINRAVQQDIEDMIIKEGMLPKLGRQDPDMKEAASVMDEMKKTGNADVKVKIVRPPELWNFPKVVEDEHQFRVVAEPRKCYIDGRIEDLEQRLEKVANQLKSNNRREWTELVRRCIDLYRGEQNEVINN